MRSAHRTAAAVLTAAPLLLVPAPAAARAGTAPTGTPAAGTATTGTSTTRTAAAGPSGIGARSAYLVDDRTGRALWARAAGTRRPIASLTKVMTALVVLRAGHLDRTITIKRKHIAYARRHGGTTAALRAGDRLTARQLLYGLMLPSGCDAAYALADAYGPGRRGFVGKMNGTARRLGLTRTRYANFDGLPWPTAHSTSSTARDQVRLGRAAMRRADFRAVAARRTYRLGATRGHHAYRWTSTNRLLGSYRGATGVKTGTTRAAGHCLLFAARRGGRTLVGVVLASSAARERARFTDATKILNWGFRTRR
ncbi:D-alanyl-D-alanine carboxypeptidase family protein [Spirillospora sp. NBC_01491]|uniref:D-alanyl-D-alanine carboxypeptidase family protein n=1 Tax=Spirillospora sp. NBC_01491 TaxID=2976007 RepID=UPI002E34CC63|nr:serine hydrolase [Spirillospora sp. NBC_01491]